MGIIAAILVIVTTGPRDSLSLLPLVYAVPPYALFSLLGAVAAFVALFRSERWAALSWAALVVNGIPGIWMLSIIMQKVSP